MEHFWERVEFGGDCWNWLGAIAASGYGCHVKGRPHRLAYEFLVGPIPAGLDLDHLCRNRRCVNPDHLEPVTRKENLRRGIQRSRQFCLRGHERTADNLYPRGTCRICAIERATTRNRTIRLLRVA